MPMQKKHTHMKPTRIIVISFLLIILSGTLLLTLPISSKSREFTPPLDALFTSTSATCVTGLIVHDTGTYWSIFGQCVIILMIQLGGLGLVTFATFFNFALGKRIGLKSLQLASESIGSDDFSSIKQLVRMVFKISMSCELLGMIALMTVFVPKYGAYGIYISLFLSISAFCNAGFDILGFENEYISLTNYADNPVVMITIMLLIICGGLGFIVWNDLFAYKKTKKLFLHTKIVLLATASLVIIGTLGVALMEWNNSKTIGDMSIPQKIWRALFQSVTFRTAGFNTIDAASMYDGTKLFSSALMFIGAAPGSTGGGIKVTTFVVLMTTVFSVIRNRYDTIVMKRRVEKEIVYKALAITVLAGLAVIITTCVIGIDKHGFKTVDIIFETASAMATVGISAGISGAGSSLSRIALILTMFLGRVGPVSLAYSFTAGFANQKKNEIIPEGKIIVG